MGQIGDFSAALEQAGTFGYQLGYQCPLFTLILCYPLATHPVPIPCIMGYLSQFEWTGPVRDTYVTMETSSRLPHSTYIVLCSLFCITV